MARRSSTRAGFREVMSLRIRYGSMHGAVWALAPLDDVETFGDLDHRGRKAAERESVWVAMSDGYIWYVNVDVNTGEVLAAYTTEQSCPPPVTDPLEQHLEVADRPEQADRTGEPSVAGAALEAVA